MEAIPPSVSVLPGLTYIHKKIGSTYNGMHQRIGTKMVSNSHKELD